MQGFANSKNKFGYVYALTLKRIAAKAAHINRFLKCKIDEYEALRSEIEAVRHEVYKDDTSPIKRK